MGFRRFAGALLAIAVVLALYAGYAPANVEKVWPLAAPVAWRIHELLPGAPAAELASAPTAAAPAASPRPSVSVVVGRAARKDLPWRIDEIGSAQAIASVALRTHFDATVEKVLVADGASVKAGETLIELDARQATAQLEGAKAQLAKDEAQLEQATRDVDRYADLVARAATPQLNLDNAKTAGASAR